MFGFSAGELMIFAVVALLLFGKRLPSTMRSLGEGIRAFKEGTQETISHSEERAV